MPLSLLAAGASKGVALALQPRFTAQTGLEIDAVFNAVGAIKDLFLGGAACDVLILTAAQIEELTAQGLLVPGAAAPLGAVSTGVAVPAGRPVPDISTPDRLATALQAAESVFIPDPHHSTAGIHFMSVLDQLGLRATIEPRLRAFPNGATAMRHLAESQAATAIGSTQITEIKYTEGLTLAGKLPDPLGLSTTYTAAISTHAPNPDGARAFLALLSGWSTQALRRDAGFE